MALAEFAGTEDSHEATITVLNPEHERPVYHLLKGLFDDEAVSVQTVDTDADGVPSDAVLVERGGAETGFAVSSMENVRDELLLVNSDIYVTGARELDDIDTPDIVTGLDELSFTVTGYPDNPREKFLLIEISRHIEAMAWRAGEGRLASGFQRLSRLEDERGTNEVYRRLGSETDVDTHVYGVPDVRPSIPNVSVHGADEAELRQSWFVVYESGQHPHEAAALVAVETEPRRWQGRWTYDSSQVEEILEYLDRTYD